MNTTIHTDETGLVIADEQQQSMDIQLPGAVNIVLLGTWLLICGAGLAVILLQKNFWAGLFIIGVPTMLGMIVKPTFALSIFMIILPTGAGVGYEQIFSLERGVGLALGVSFLFSLLISRPRMRIGCSALWLFVAFTFWVVLSSVLSSSGAASGYLEEELKRAFTMIQLLALTMIVFWIIVNNGEYALKWALRSYILGSLGTIAITFITGAAMASQEEGGQERYKATLGSSIDANFLAALLAMALLAAIYLVITDRSIVWRIVCVTAVVVIPVMMIKAGSRGALVALLVTLMSPLLFIRQVVRRPALALGLLTTIIVVCGVTLVLFKSQGVSERLSSRLTNVRFAVDSIAIRIGFISAAVNTAAKYPFGTGEFLWFDRAQISYWPHNDFFYCLGIYGYLGALLFGSVIIALMIAVKRMPLSVNKVYVRAVLTFSIIMGLNIRQIHQKHYWVFMAIILAIAELARRRQEERMPSVADEVDVEFAERKEHT